MEDLIISFPKRRFLHRESEDQVPKSNTEWKGNTEGSPGWALVLISSGHIPKTHPRLLYFTYSQAWKIIHALSNLTCYNS